MNYPKVYLVIILLLACWFPNVYGQKKLLRQEDYNWPGISNKLLTDDGQFAVFTIDSAGTSKLLIQSLVSNVCFKIPGASQPIVLNTSNKVEFSDSGKIGVIDLKTGTIGYITDIISYKVNSNPRREIIAYVNGKDTSTLKIFNVLDGSEIRLLNVKKYEFSPKGNVLLVEQEGSNNQHQTIIALGLIKEFRDTLTCSSISSDYCFSRDERGVAYCDSINDGEKFLKSICYYNFFSHKLTRFQLEPLNKNQPNFAVDVNSLVFDCPGKRLFFYLTKKPVDTAVSKGTDTRPIIWSNSDDRFETTGTLYRPKQKFFLTLSLQTGKFLFLTDEADDSDVQFCPKNSDWVLIAQKSKIRNLMGTDYRYTIKLVSTIDGSKIILKGNLLGDSGFSADGKFVIWFDRDTKTYWTYDLSLKRTIPIGKDVLSSLIDYKENGPVKTQPSSFGIAGWTPFDEKVIINDRYDLWMVDPRGKSPSINLTNSYGKKNNIVFRIPVFRSSFSDSTFCYDPQKQDLLSAFDTKNKCYGYFRLQPNANCNPQKLMMGAFARPTYSDFPIKAKNAQVSLVIISSCTHYYNLCYTKDFKKYTALTDMEPQKDYNWVKSELVHWKIRKGETGEGILYKPENFDPRKKYPIIFTFYEKDSDNLNDFLFPGLSSGRLNIAYYVSNGYSVFDPNIYYKVGNPGASACETILSSIKYFVSKLPFVNQRKMGIEGHSWGGYQVNYIISQMKLFSAAVSAEGVTDFISNYNSLKLDAGVPSQFHYELLQGRMGRTLWEIPAQYISNSPIFFADKVSTPLLMLDNPGDQNVPWQQGLEYFLALRRLNKKVWLLQYNNEGHVLAENSDRLDFSNRMAQFFDYYLKDASEPLWMTKNNNNRKY